MSPIRSRAPLGQAERITLLDRFQRELDASEKIAAMEHSYQRIAPYIVEVEQPGASFALIIYHRESEAWFGKAGEDGSFRHLLEGRAIRRGDVVFDLGCNSGFATCWYATMAGPGGKVVGFDPFPWNAIATRYSAELNGLHNVEVFQVGIGATAEKTRISLHDARISSRTGAALLDVTISPLASFASYRPNVLKIDIEGAEYEVSQADFATFDRLRLCVLELHPGFIEERGHSAQECLANFARQGFDIRRDLSGPAMTYRPTDSAPPHGFYYLQRPVPLPVWSAMRRAIAPVSRLRPTHRLRSALAVRDRMIREREATVRERERTVVDRERTIRAKEEEIRRLEATVAALRSGAAPPEAVATPPAAPEAPEDVAVPASLPAGLADRIRAALPHIEGWCSERKALWLADLITSNRCLAVLEIGIYGGRSLIPMAMAVQALGAGGKVHGVEAWSNSVAVATETNAENDAWWQTVDLKAIRKGFLRSVARNGVADTVVVLEMSSDEAFATISRTGLGPFDLVHVDGSHSEVQALRDVEMWSSLVRPGGILVLDDIGWPSVMAAREHVRRNFSDIGEIVESGTTAYGAYRRGQAPDATSSQN